MKKVLPFIFFTLLLGSCGRVFQFVILGIRAPKPETEVSIMKYGKKAGYNTENQFYFIDSLQVKRIWKGAFPKAFIYDEEGYVVQHLDCFASGVEDLRKFYQKPLGSAPRVSNTMLILYGNDTIKTVAPNLFELKNNVHTFMTKEKVELPKSKYYLVFYWSKSFGRINKKVGAEMEKYLISHPEFSTTFIKVNCDYQKRWGYTKKQLR